MPNYRKQIWSGDVYEVEEYYSPRQAGEKYARGDNVNLTPDQQRELNARRATKQLSRLVNANFGPKDLFITLTHAERVNRDDAIKFRTAFLRKVNRIRAKKSLPTIRYIAVTECGSGREHHHIIISGGMSLDEILDCWQQGRAMVSKIESGGDYTGLANYISKEPPEEHKKRWSQSRNLKKPTVKRSIIKGDGGRRRPMRVPKGYKVIQQNEYYSEETGETRYMRAVKIGGADYAQGKAPPAGTDRDGMSGNIRKGEIR